MWHAGPRVVKPEVSMWRRWLAVGLSVAALGCGGGPAEDTGFWVGLVTPGPVSDAGWNAAAYEGLKRIETELGAQTAHQESSTPAEFEEIFRDFGARGFSLVFGHGFEFQDAAVTAGEAFPNTAYVVTSGRVVRPNVAGLIFELEEAAYLAGVLAAHLSESEVTGMVGGMEIPPVRLIFDGYRRGFLTVRPEGVVKEVYLGNWEDAAGARQASRALVAQGADVLIHNADAAGLGVFQACRETGTLAIGTNRDQAAVAPEVVVASAVIDVPGAMLRVAREVRDGRFEGQLVRFDLASGIIDLVLNPNLESRISDETRVALQAARRDVVTGDVRLEHFGK